MEKSLQEMRDLADQAQAENESGVIAGQEVDQAYLDGVADALCWAVGDPPSDELAALLQRRDEAIRLSFLRP